MINFLMSKKTDKKNKSHKKSSNSFQNLFKILNGFDSKKNNIDVDILQDIEDQLLMADLGVKTTEILLDNICVSRKNFSDSKTILNNLKFAMHSILESVARPLYVNEAKNPFVILMVGVNGSGKTTTIGKLARKFQNEGKKVMLAAGDTFRAAAIEQLQIWGKRNSVPVVSQQSGSDSAAVIFDALESAKAKNIDILIADTAGRLHTKDNLMMELKKIKKVLKKLDKTAPHEILLTLDASIGQNALQQAKHFHQEIGVDGIVMTKLDGTAKGGILFAVSNELKIPIRFVGIGEAVNDLKVFSADDFIDALFV